MASSSPDSAVLSEAGRRLSDRDTLGAIDLLQGWSEEHLPSPSVTDLLDFLQLPEAKSVAPSNPDTARPAAIPTRRLWSVRAQGEFRADHELPALGGLDLQRGFPLAVKVGFVDVLAGFSAGSWLEDAKPYTDMDLWTGVEFRRPTWDGRVEGWGGWTESDQPEAGISGLLESKGKWRGWEFGQGPMARYSWRRSRFLGWSAQGVRPGALGSLELGGTIRVRQDPVWPVVLDYDSVPVRFARDRAQTTFHAGLVRQGGALRYGPQLDLDGRISFAPDRWMDSAGFTPKWGTKAPRAERRAELGCTASGFVRWDPSPAWSAEGALGWTWAAEEGAGGLDLSPFTPGPFLRLSARSSF